MKLMPTLILAGGLTGGLLCAAEEAKTVSEPGNQILLTIIQTKGGG